MPPTIAREFDHGFTHNIPSSTTEGLMDATIEYFTNVVDVFLESIIWIIEQILHVVSTVRQKSFFHAQRLSIFIAQQGGFMVKRAFDFTVACIVMLLLSPLFFLVVLAIRLDSRGPILFSQERIGKNGKVFKMWKFRSMYVDAEQRKAELMKQNQMKGGVLFKMKDDPRITRVGKFIRKFSIDELPQLQNVLLGTMSLVGPRPPVPSEVAQYTPYQRQRLEVIPGITCIWQVSGRSNIPFVQQVEMDIEYASTQSFWKDITLLFKTVPAVLSARGAY